MKPIVKGMFARSLAGHDKGKLYVISDVQEPYVFLWTEKSVPPTGRKRRS